LAFPWPGFETAAAQATDIERMRTTLLMGLLLASPAVARAEDRPRFHLSGAAGFGVENVESTNLGVGLGYSVIPHLSLGADLSYSYLPLGPYARGGGNRAWWGLATLTVTPLPSAKVSPYLVLGYGIGRYVDSSRQGELGRAVAGGAGLQVRLGDRANLFVEGRFGLMDGITAADGLHMELPVRAGVRFGL
jgi:hypothetical protein